MLSRVAESLYWMSRNIERAESLARVIDVAFNRTVDRNAAGRDRAQRMWRRVLELSGTRESPPEIEGPSAALEAFSLSCFDVDNRSSLISCVRVARANALGVRAELTTEVWESINSMYLFVESQSPAAIAREGPSGFLRRIRDAGVAFGGIVDATLTHGDEWLFLQLGRYIERGSMTARILQTHDLGDDSAAEWQRLLEMCCASEPFARAQRHSSEPSEVIAFLLLHDAFPRSVRFCVGEVDRALHRISETPPGSYSNETERLTGRLHATLDFAQLQEIIDDGPIAFTVRVADRLATIGAAIETTYFPRVPVA